LDNWTKLLISSLKYSRYEDEETRSVDGVIFTASDALQNYMHKSGGLSAIERYKGITVIFPRLAEVVINIVLTVCLRIDGFSSALIARREIRNYLLESKKMGFPPICFLSKLW
jgi:hypothetical protein